MYSDFKIVISGDKNYFKFIKRFESNIYLQFGYYPIIYDVGLTKKQKSTLKSEIRVIHTSLNFSSLSDAGFINATHKPMCIKDVLEKDSKSCLFLDADMLFSRKVNPSDFDLERYDIGVTPRHVTERYEELYTNGLINSGTMFFNNNLRVLDFIDKWIEDCSKGIESDQLALSNLISRSKDLMFSSEEIFINGINFKLLNASKYNDVSLSDGLILHYKGAAGSVIKYYRYVWDYFSIQNNLRLRKFGNKIFGLISKLSKFFG